ncbi:MAG: DUF4980 domain-containing protein [Bacteroides sp.]|nr:DUF4980 domain-containing protein [Bacteroides sp.]
MNRSIIAGGVILASLSGGSLPVSAETVPLTPQCLSETNALVRANTTQGKYILLPVQENAAPAHIRVLSDGRLDETLNINLAENRIDFYVPLRLDGRDGEEILLDIRTSHDRAHTRDTQNSLWSSEIKISDEFDTSNREKYRPAFHHTPLYGWMNDPNGMFYKDGVWHLSYQWNPYGSKWENMSWGHSSSKDLIHWEAQEPVLYRDALGAVFSGSAVIDKENTAGFGHDSVIAIYTSADASQVQSLAHSSDGGMTYERYAKNPIITYERESRDPNMFWDADNSRWVLLLASALDHEMLIFTSPDLKEWTLQSKFGKDFGAQDGVWECPDLLRLPIEGTDREKWVLICNINPGGPFGGSATQYFVGEFDGNKFVCDTPPEVTKWMDYGKDHYATVSFHNAPDNRTTVIGWMSNWQYANEVPTVQYRSANTLPRDLKLFEFIDGQTYLASVPSPEVDILRGTPKNYRPGKIGKGLKRFSLPSATDGLCEIDFDADLKNGSRLEITLSNQEGEKVVMTLNSEDDTFSMDRTSSGLTDFSEHFPCVTVAPAYNATGKYSVRIFIDRSSIEAFSYDGHFAMTNLVFPTSPYNSVSFSSPDGNAKVNLLTIYPLK